MQQNKILLFTLALFFSLTWSVVLPAQTTIDSIVALGDDLMNLEDYEQAQATYERALNMNQTYIPALKGNIDVLLALDQYGRAEKAASEALEKHPQNPAFHMYMGKVLIERGYFEKALPHLNKSLNFAGENDSMIINRVYVNRGAAYQKLGNTQKALQNYSQALSINRHNPNVFIYRGNLYYQQQNYSQALEDFQRVLELDPNNHVAQYNVGMCHFKQGKKRKACDAFHKACELGNTNACKMVISKCLRNPRTQ